MNGAAAEARSNTAEAPDEIEFKTARTLRERDAWLDQALRDHRLGDGDRCLAARLALHLNIKTGQLNPSYEVLAAGTGKTVAAIPKQLGRLETAGLIRRHSTRGRYANHYDLVLKATRTTDHGRGSTLSGGTGIKSSNPVRPSVVTTNGELFEPYPIIHTNREGDRNNEKNREKESVSPPFAALFEQFWNQYPRRVDKASARKALERVLRTGHVSFETIMAGCLRYAAERMNEDPKFTKHPKNWLVAEAWGNEAYVSPPKPRTFADSLVDGMLEGLSRHDFE